MATLFEVIEKFLKEPENIGEVFRTGKEFYFRYGKHCFSIIKRFQDIQKYGDYTFYVYPAWTSSLGELDMLLSVGVDEAEPQMVAYHVKEYPEIRTLLISLYKLLEEKDLKIDEIFKDVLKT